MPNAEDLHEQASITDLQDIRRSPAYDLYLKKTGGKLDKQHNGYKSLEKIDRARLKFSCGNLMQIQMR